MNKIINITVMIILGAGTLAVASEAGKDFSDARRLVGQGNRDFAFMHYQALLRQTPKGGTTWTQAEFGVGEYYFLIADYKDAAAAFKEILTVSRKFEHKIFALMYLLKMEQKKNNKENVEDLEQKIRMLRQHSFVFRKNKTYAFRSPLNRQYKVIYYIDRIEFLVEDKLIEKVSL